MTGKVLSAVSLFIVVGLLHNYFYLFVKFLFFLILNLLCLLAVTCYVQKCPISRLSVYPV